MHKTTKAIFLWSFNFFFTVITKMQMYKILKPVASNYLILITCAENVQATIKIPYIHEDIQPIKSHFRPLLTSYNSILMGFYSGGKGKKHT